MSTCCKASSCAQGQAFPAILLSAPRRGKSGSQGSEGCSQYTRLCWKAQRSSVHSRGSCGPHRVSGGRQSWQKQSCSSSLPPSSHLHALGQGGFCSSAVLSKSLRLLLCFQVFCPGEGLGGHEENPCFNTPVCREFLSGRGGSFGYSKRWVKVLTKQKQHQLTWRKLNLFTGWTKGTVYYFESFPQYQIVIDILHSIAYKIMWEGLHSWVFPTTEARNK